LLTLCAEAQTDSSLLTGARL